jgi:hypothetical protein
LEDRARGEYIKNTDRSSSGEIALTQCNCMGVEEEDEGNSYLYSQFAFATNEILI